MPNYRWSAWNPLKVDPGSVPITCLFPLKDERSYPELEDFYQLQTLVHVGRKETAWRKVSDTRASSEYAILKFSLKKLQVDNISGTKEGNMSQTRAHRLSLTTRSFSSSGAHTFSPWQKCFPLPNPGWYITSESFTHTQKKAQMCPMGCGWKRISCEQRGGEAWRFWPRREPWPGF